MYSVVQLKSLTILTWRLFEPVDRESSLLHPLPQEQHCYSWDSDYDGNDWENSAYGND